MSDPRFDRLAGLVLDHSLALKPRQVLRIQGGEAAEPLAQSYLFVDAADVPAPPEDAFWPHDLEGCEVFTESGRALGRITEIVHGEANDVWVATADGAETLVPALKDVVVSVDVPGKRVVIREIPGLTDG